MHRQGWGDFKSGINLKPGINLLSATFEWLERIRLKVINPRIREPEFCELRELGDG